MSRLKFRIEAVAEGSRARCARFQTLHGEVFSPVFMPVGTQATVKAQTLGSLTQVKSQVLLANTYHLLLRPGIEVFKKLGGIHQFMKWNGPVLTDSGGFQIFSLPHSRKISDHGAEFKSYIDGKLIQLTPELSIEMQKAIGSDIMMVLDQCVPSTSDYALAKEAMDRTHLWARRSLDARGDSQQALFAIVQGACFTDLRKQSADTLTQMGFDGFAIGGLAVGETKEQREDFTEFSAQLLPSHLPRYLMGVGTPIDILEAVHRGVDLFDCILPTALAQRGTAFTSQGKLQLRRGAYKFSQESLDPKCGCMTCETYSKAYLHHLIKAEETLGWHLLGLHNLTFYHKLMANIRNSILEGRFLEFYSDQRVKLQITDGDLSRNAQRKLHNDFSLDAAPQVNSTDAIKLVPELAELGDYRVHSAPSGFYSIQQKSSGEIMHSVISPLKEARELYVEQSRLIERVQEQSSSEFIIWDVGLGAGANAMSAVHAYEEVAAKQKCRPFRLVSFEIDLDPLRLAYENRLQFSYLDHPAIPQLLEKNSWESTQSQLKWDLYFGDFYETLSNAPLPDVIFFDPFSAKTNANLWGMKTLEKIFSYCSARPMELFTYSSSTSVRAAFFQSGFFVARGVGTGPKSETTVALNASGQASSYHLLEKDWLRKWSKSTAKYPIDLEIEKQSLFQERLFAHPQWTLSLNI